MAKLERRVNMDFDELLKLIEDGVLHGSCSATLEDSSDFSKDGSRCSVRVFERYSTFGGNRVSLNVTLFQPVGGLVMLSAITSGGSQAIFFKINTVGEENFLRALEVSLPARAGSISSCARWKRYFHKTIGHRF